MDNFEDFSPFQQHFSYVMIVETPYNEAMLTQSQEL